MSYSHSYYSLAADHIDKKNAGRTVQCNFVTLLKYSTLGWLCSKKFGISEKHGVPLRVLENDIWKTGFRFFSKSKIDKLLAVLRFS